jgi:alkylation response protein AidB-like acyl-CoA dehydrogenase
LGSEAQKRQYLEPIASGSMLTALAFAEPEGESAEHITSVAKCRGEQFIINGSKSHVQLADQAELLLVLARTAESESERGLTLFCVDVRTEGVEILPVDTMGQRGANRCRVRFNNVQVTADNILGGIQKMGEARQQLGTLQNIVQIAYAACGIGLARGAFEYALQYAGEREQFGQTIVRFPAIAQMLAEVESKTEAARLMLYKAAWMLDMDKDCQREVSMALTLGTEVSVKAAMDGLQILGGYGYTMEYDIQRFVRDSAAMLSMGKRLDALNGQIARRYTL